MISTATKSLIPQRLFIFQIFNCQKRTDNKFDDDDDDDGDDVDDVDDNDDNDDDGVIAIYVGEVGL